MQNNTIHSKSNNNNSKIKENNKKIGSAIPSLWNKSPHRTVLRPRKMEQVDIWDAREGRGIIKTYGKGGGGKTRDAVGRLLISHLLGKE